MEVDRCSECGNPILDSHAFSRCDVCDEPLSEAAKQSLLRWPAPQARAGSRVLNRYRDAYRMARTLLKVGRWLGLGAGAAGGYLLIAAWVAASEHRRDAAFLLVALACCAWLACVGAVLLSGIGHLCGCVLDGVVAISPLLDEGERGLALGHNERKATKVAPDRRAS